MTEIETLTDWNERLGCCCRMPGFPSPGIDYESIFLALCGFSLPQFEGMTEAQKNARYETLDITRTYNETWNWSESEFSFGSKTSGNRTLVHDYRTAYRKSDASGSCLTIKKSSSHSGNLNDRSTVEYPESSSFEDHTISSSETWKASGGENQPATGTRRVTANGTDEYGDDVNTSSTFPYTFHGLEETYGITVCKFRGGSTFSHTVSTQADPDDFYKISTSDTITRVYGGKLSLTDLLNKKKFPEDAKDNYTTSARNLITFGNRTRFRFVIPSSHLGSWFKVSWDYLDEPQGWNETIADPNHTGPGTPKQIPKPGRPKRHLSTGGTWVWSGPGSQSEPNGDSWKSPWQEIPFPQFKGIRKVVNIRFEGYRSPYGSKPLVTGEAIDESEL